MTLPYILAGLGWAVTGVATLLLVQIYLNMEDGDRLTVKDLFDCAFFGSLFGGVILVVYAVFLLAAWAAPRWRAWLKKVVYTKRMPK